MVKKKGKNANNRQRVLDLYCLR